MTTALSRRKFVKVMAYTVASTATASYVFSTNKRDIESKFQSIEKRFPNLLRKPKVISVLCDADGNFPNNPNLPVVLYQGLFDPDYDDCADSIEAILNHNKWPAAWRAGVYGYHHYHARAHECLACYRGSAVIQCGGPNGKEVEIKAGDVVVIPAGVSHKKISSTWFFRVIGAYPPGQSPDMNYGKDGERPEADQLIAAVPSPSSDPVYGKRGPILTWQTK